MNKCSTPKRYPAASKNYVILARSMYLLLLIVCLFCTGRRIYHGIYVKYGLHCCLNVGAWFGDTVLKQEFLGGNIGESSCVKVRRETFSYCCHRENSLSLEKINLIYCLLTG